uniref:RING-type domain-containing protein n=1 Tax=Kalanchoe fedtschenkoi TaxID=63787 RepID=A0A7N0VGP0_KALFE
MSPSSQPDFLSPISPTPNSQAPSFLLPSLQISETLKIPESQMPSDQSDDSSSSPAAATASSDHHQPPMMSKPSPKILSLILRAIIMSLLTSLFFLFVGIAAIFLVHLFLAGRHLHRHRRRQSQFPSSSSSGISQFDLHHPPGFRFDGGSNLDSGSECVICLDRIRDGDFFRILPGCSHAFHLDCIDTWLVKASACPICRARVICAGSGMGADGDQCKQLWTVRA